MAGRIELKYLIDWRQKVRLLDAYRPFLVPAPFTDEYATYPIMSLYYDSPSLRFFDEKLEGEMLRNKVRLRGYGYRWRALAPVFLEVKRKVDQRILKYRRRFERYDPSLLEPSTWPLDDLESARDRRDAAQVAALVHQHRLRPAVQILYQRQGFESPLFRSLRIAFDSRIVALHPGQAAEPWVFDHPSYRVLDDTHFVFEVKSDGGLPGWVLDGLRAAQVTQRAISKYCLGIEKLGLADREIGVYA
ncbi:MAG: VTC domain-containing protein [Acidobacteriota bacterium]